ncbi:VWA domain-containing protein [Bacillus sp. E(2018)]|uniref:VWA domain-containing protein n=1 Tax=Bacillus sp. E(2018) TaxID=2502239 RepID=UPI001485476E|nr:VWA domain-containing protein [Bacillus sp. E(2018)]
MFKKVHIFFVLLVMTFMFAGCSDKEDASKENTVKTQNTIKEDQHKIPDAPRNFDEMIDQEQGVMMKKYMDPKLEGKTGMDYNQFYDDEFQPKSEKAFNKYFKQNKKLTTQEVYNYLVHQLASNQYKTYYEQLLAYEHGYRMPELPSSPDEIAEEKQPKAKNIVILLDASGSMKAKVNGGVKMDLAKETIKKFTSDLSDDTSVSLFAYGHIGTGKDNDKQKSCEGIEAVYPLQTFNTNSFDQSLNAFDASGWTPLAGAIEKANELLSKYPESKYDNMVYIVSDGVETCDGDPVEAAKKLTEQSIQAKLNIIGFDVDDKGQQQLMKVAEAGNGQYATVTDKASLEDQVLKKWRPTIGQLVWTQGVSGRDYIDARKRLNDSKIPLDEISDREESRIRNAVLYLKTNEYISSKTGEEVIERAEESNDIRKAEFQRVYDEKKEEADKAENEINDKVKAWKDKWEKEINK